MEMLQNMKAKNEKKDNKGFSLVELIIVITIMAILVGIVGTLTSLRKQRICRLLIALEQQLQLLIHPMLRKLLIILK